MMNELVRRAEGDRPQHITQAGPVIDRSLYTDPKVFEEEITRIFERAWLYVAHESELRKPGDFRTADLAGQPVLAVKGSDGQIRVLYNSCRHRGAMVELEKGGNRSAFRCLYHHWEYGNDGKLIAVPRREGQGPDFDLSHCGLISVPRVEVYEGLVFASLDPQAPPLADFIGAGAPYVKEVATYLGKPISVYGSYEYTYNANWKLICENTVDDYHQQYLHGATYRESVKRLGGLGISGAFMGGRAAKDLEASRRNSDLGIHGCLAWRAEERNLTHQSERSLHVHISVFPSILLLYDPIRDVVGFRVIKPEAVDKTRVLTVCLGPDDADPARRRGIAERFNHNWGPTGRVGPDDTVCFEYLQKGLRARAGGDVLITRGLHRDPHNGIAADEHAPRAVWNGWRHFMLGERV
jgi:phenylpropionate dioxygenase-like ring-hydroxylating dioxygenase large terminal subunit